MAPNHAKDGVTEKTFGDGDKCSYSLHKNDKEEIGQKARGSRASKGENKSLGFQSVMELGLGQAIGLFLNPIPKDGSSPTTIEIGIITKSGKRDYGPQK